MLTEPLLQAVNVTVVYHDGDVTTEALGQFDFQISSGESVCVLGPSGCGKTTLLRALGGLIAPSTGRIMLQGTEVTGPSQRIGVIFQQSTLFPWLTVRGNIDFALKANHSSRQRREQLARQLLTLVGLTDFADVRPPGLSGGMAQRASLARALATEPEVLLLDEPFGALDAVSRLQMHDVLLDIWKRLQMAMVFVTHDVDEAVGIGDRIVIMTRRPGRLASEIRIELPRPRVADGVRCAGFEDVRNAVAAAARDLYATN